MQLRGTSSRRRWMRYLIIWPLSIAGVLPFLNILRLAMERVQVQWAWSSGFQAAFITCWMVYAWSQSLR